MKQSTKNVSLVSVIGLIVLMMAAILTRLGEITASPLPLVVTLQPLAAWTDDLVVKHSELPPGWKPGGQTSQSEQGALVRVYWFQHAEAQVSGATLSEDIAVYPTVVLAQQAYPSMRDVYFPPAYADKWKIYSELSIQHHADEIKTACLPGAQFNGSQNLSCRSIARYQNVIVLTNGVVLPDKVLTLENFREMLEAVDRRIVEVLSRKQSG